MATSQDGKTFKQDMVVSIRYRNDLPPPPMPPKLLEIDHEGISQYLTTGFASGIARREQPNIDVDAEGGMAIDMIGIPGYFQGDESAIMAPELPPMLEQADLNLLMTPEQLKNEAAMNAGHSFLRKTQYMNAANARAGNDPFMSDSRQKKQAEKAAAAATPVMKDDPENIKRNIQKGFDLAYPGSVRYDSHKGEPITTQERNAWNNPKHPTNPMLKPVSFHSVLPDFDATTDGGFNWHYVKFAKPPLPIHREKRDPRIDAAFIMAYQNQKEHAGWAARKEAYDRDPQNYEDPGDAPQIWPLFIPSQANSSTSAVYKIRKLFNNGEPDKDNEADMSELTTPAGNGESRVPFDRARIYGSVKQEYPDSRRFMGLTLFEPKTANPESRHQKQGPAAYYYPIFEKDLFKAERGQLAGASKSGARAGEDEYADTPVPDQLMLLPLKEEAVPASTRYVRAQWQAKYDYTFTDKWKQLEAAAVAEQAKEQAKTAADASDDGRGDVTMAENEDMDTDGAVTGNGVSSVGGKGRPVADDGDSDLMEDD